MRLLVLLKFVPREWWRPRGWLRLRPYIKFRIETFGRRPTLAETWRYLGWCRRMNRER